MNRRQRNFLLSFFFCVTFACSALSWYHSRGMRARWENVPPVPSEKAAKAFFMGDRQFAYRTTGIMMQNLGNTGGRAIALSDYDYNRLLLWLRLSDSMDSRSSFMPFLAAFYFGASQDKEDVRLIVSYLADIGRRSGSGQWRWLAHAVYLARYELEDYGLALDLANELSGKWEPGRPLWMKQMSAFILTAQGDKDAAYKLLTGLLQDKSEGIHPTEMNFMVSYICERILDPAVAANHPLCVSPEGTP